MREAAKAHKKRFRSDGLGGNRIVKKDLYADKLECQPRDFSNIGYSCDLYLKGKPIVGEYSQWDKDKKLYDYDKGVSYAMDFDLPHATSISSKGHYGGTIDIELDRMRNCNLELHPKKHIKGRLSCG